VPFLYVIWFGRLYLRAVPRTLFWGALLLFGLGLAITSLLVGTAGAGKGGEESEEREAFGLIYPGRVRQLASQIHFAGRSPYFKIRLAQRLRALVLESLDRGSRHTPVEFERALDELDAPPRIRAFLQEEKRLTSLSRSVGLLNRLKARFLGGSGKAAGISRADLEHVVQFLEDRVEGL